MSDSMIRFNYVSKKTGRTVEGLRFDDGDKQTRPFDVYRMDARGLIKFLDIMGDSSGQVLEWFAIGDTLTSNHPDIAFATWKGHAVIHVSVGGSRPMAFGKANARKLAHALYSLGMAEVKAGLEAYLGEYVPAKAEAPKGKGKGKGKGKAEKAAKPAKAARKPKVEADAPKAEADPRDEQIVALQAQMAEMMKAMQALLAAK